MMSGSLKRVVSNPENEVDESNAVVGGDSPNPSPSFQSSFEKNLASQPANCNLGEGCGGNDETAMVVEDDEDMNAPVSAVRSDNHGNLAIRSGGERVIGSSTAMSNISNLSDQSVTYMYEEEQAGQSTDARDDVNDNGEAVAKEMSALGKAMLRGDQGGAQFSFASSSSGVESSSYTTQGHATSSGNWGWFEDVHGSAHDHAEAGKKKSTGLLGVTPLNDEIQPHKIEASSMAVSAPTYVLGESLSTQKLWKHTAGHRPPQPFEERAFYEKMWAQNFAQSKVIYKMPVEVLTASSNVPLSPYDGNFAEDDTRGTDMAMYSVGGDNHAIAPEDAAQANLLNQNSGYPGTNNRGTVGPHRHHHTVVNKKVKSVDSGDQLTVLVQGDNVFGTTVSKSFPRPGMDPRAITGVDTVNISIASYRVVESKKRGKYAQFLVVYREGSFQDTVGVWKRYSAFDELARKVTHGHESCSSVLVNMTPLAVTDDYEVELLPNAITSWRLLKKRQRWYRCLDAGYLSLKVFLLERFLHDILFECSSPKILRDFVGVDAKHGASGGGGLAQH